MEENQNGFHFKRTVESCTFQQSWYQQYLDEKKKEELYEKGKAAFEEDNWGSCRRSMTKRKK